MNDIMIDIETLGTRPGSIVLSIGAVRFDTKGLGEEFYSVIRESDSKSYGLRTSPNTVAWWAKQDEIARDVLTKARDPMSPSLNDVLILLSSFIKPNDKVWGNGANFDIVLIEALYDNVGLQIPWKYYNVRCFRTLKNLYPILSEDKRIERTGAHNALEDAKYQARLASIMLRNLSKEQS